MTRNVAYWLAVALVLGFAAALWGSHLTDGAPFVYHPDEPHIMARGIQMVLSGDLNPRWFHYPSLYIMLQGQIAALVHWLADVPLAPGSEVLFEGAPAEVLPHYVAGRVLTLLFALGTTFMVFELVRELTNRWLGLLAGIAFAMSGLVLRSAVFIKVDIPLTFFVTLSAYLMCRSAPSWSIAVTGALAAGMKYPGALVLLVLAALILVRRGLTRRAALEVLGSAALAIVVFIATTPYAVLDPKHFWDPEVGWVHDIIHYRTGHYGADRGSSALKMLHTLYQDASPLVLLAPLGVLAAKRDRRVLILLALLVIVATPVAVAKVYFERNSLPLVPPSLALACCALHMLAQRLTPALQTALGVAVAGIALFAGKRMVLPNIENLGYEDSRTLAYRWAVANMPRGSRVLREAFTPHLHFVPKLSVTSRFTVADMPVAELENNFDYVVTTQALWDIPLDRQRTTYGWLFERKPVYQTPPYEGSGHFPIIRIDALTRLLPEDLEKFTVFRVSEEDGFGDVVAGHEVVLEPPAPGVAGPLFVRSLGRDPGVLSPELPLLSSKTYILRVALTTPARTRFQLYYLTQTTPHYQEQKSVQRVLDPGRNEFDLSFGGDSLRGRLRLDVGDRPGVYAIHAIALYAPASS